MKKLIFDSENYKIILEKFEIVSHQYASLSLRDHRSMLSGRDFTILSLDLNQDEDEIITETDSASYNRF